MNIVRVIEDFNNRIGAELKELEKTVSSIAEDSGSTCAVPKNDVPAAVCYHSFNPLTLFFPSIFFIFLLDFFFLCRVRVSLVEIS